MQAATAHGASAPFQPKIEKRGRAGFAPFASESSRAPCGRTHRHALQAGSAFSRANLNQPIDRKPRRASLGALAAIDARPRLAPDACRAEQRRQPNQRAVRDTGNGTRSSAPRAKAAPAPAARAAGFAEVAEEVQHLHVGDDSVGAGEKAGQRLDRHSGDDPDEEAEQQVLQSAQRNVHPARQTKIAAEEVCGQVSRGIPKACRPGTATNKTICAAAAKPRETPAAGTFPPDAPAAADR